eukprot:11116084-Ditylum_brightwellii.AAC.1
MQSNHHKEKKALFLLSYLYAITKKKKVLSLVSYLYAITMRRRRCVMHPSIDININLNEITDDLGLS